jgi:hypothetical protein
MAFDRPLLRAISAALAATALIALTLGPASAASPTYDITTLAGKIASLRGTAGLQVRFSGLLEEEGGAEEVSGSAPDPITPDFVLSSPLDGTTIQAPNVLVNQDTHAAPQNETSIAVDPNNPNRIVASMNDYVARTWSCDINGTPCSALAEASSGTYYSNDGGATWCCVSSDPNHLGTLIPGITRLTGGIYEAAGDPSVAFDSQGHVYYAGLGFNRLTPPNTVAVNRGTFDGSGHLSWSQPTFINQTTSPSTITDKEWIAVDSHASSPFRDRVYVTYTRFLFNPQNGRFVEAPIFFASSSDGGHTFTSPKSIVGNVLYGSGSRPVVGPDGTLYVFWKGATRTAALDGTWVVKSTDGGMSFSKPVLVSTLSDNPELRDTAFRVNSFPAAAAAPNGDLYATWNASVPNDGSTYAGTIGCFQIYVGEETVEEDCHTAAIWSRSTDGGATWSAPAPVFPQANRIPIGYPVTQPSPSAGCTAAQGCDGSPLNAPDADPIDDVFPAVGVGPNGAVYIGAYRDDVVSPWQTCANEPAPPLGRITCPALGPYINNGRLDYVVQKLGGSTQIVSTQHINTRYGFGGTFFGDYTDLAVGSDNKFHALYTDSNDVQSVTWFYGLEFTPTPIHQEDIVIATGQ